MRLLVDLNVVLDVLLDRAPHVEPSSALWALVERGEAEGRIAAHAVTTLHYLAKRARGSAFAAACVRDVLSVFPVAPVDGPVIQHALSLDTPDFEDAVSAASALSVGCDALVTRDAAGFRGAPLPVLDPAAASAAIRASGGSRGSS